MEEEEIIGCKLELLEKKRKQDNNFRQLMEEEEEEEEIIGCKLELPLTTTSSNSFKLENAICNHGFFMMPPNRWIPKTKSLQRPLTLPDSTSVMVSISHSSPTSLSVHVQAATSDHQLTSRDKQSILVQVKRMLRLSNKEDNAVKEFHMMHPKAKEKSFGRLFRAPTLFEDVVKSILLCNSRFSRSLEMAQRLCKLQHLVSTRKSHIDQCPRNCKRKTRAKAGSELGSKRKKSMMDKSSSVVVKVAKLEEMELIDLDQQGMKTGNFPNAHEIIGVGEKILKKICKLGHRARTIVRFAQCVVGNKIGLDEETEGFEKELSENLMKIKGVGPYVCDSVMMCVGVYNVVPQDSETLRHLREVHGKGDCTTLRRAKEIVKQIYNTYEPFQCLAFWFEMVESYERVFGKLSELSHSDYGSVGGYRVGHQV